MTFILLFCIASFFFYVHTHTHLNRRKNVSELYWWQNWSNTHDIGAYGQNCVLLFLSNDLRLPTSNNEMSGQVRSNKKQSIVILPQAVYLRIHYTRVVNLYRVCKQGEKFWVEFEAVHGKLNPRLFLSSLLSLSCTLRSRTRQKAPQSKVSFLLHNQCTVLYSIVINAFLLLARLIVFAYFPFRSYPCLLALLLPSMNTNMECEQSHGTSTCRIAVTFQMSVQLKNSRQGTVAIKPHNDCR